VTVVGTGSFTRTDGSTGVLADSVFRTGAVSAEQQRPFEAANSNSVLLGAIAAAGLAAAPAAAETHFVERGVAANIDAGAAQGAGDNPIAAQVEPSLTSRVVDMLQAAADAHDAAQFSSHGETREPVPSADEHTLSGTESAAQSGPAQLLAATETPAQPEQSATTAAGVMMPSAEQLQAMGYSAAGPEAQQSSEIVSKVLVDALHGGGHGGPDLDTLLNALPGHSGGAPGLAEIIGSHSGSAASAWDAHALSGFSAAHLDFGLEMLAVHQAAVPAT
jgi:hypothetical protein